MKTLGTLFAVAFTLVCMHISSSAAPGTTPRIEPVVDADFYNDGKFPEAQVELGRLLFFDKILSGNQNISCATCHHPKHFSTDGLSLPIGEGGTGLGPDRKVSEGKGAIMNRVPRNSQALFFRGAKAFERLFHDGRVEVDQYKNWPSGFWSPAREQLPAGLDNVLAVQAMFPVTSEAEMAGQKSENPVATASSLDNLGHENGVWDVLGKRLREVPEYVELFKKAYPDKVKSAADVNYVLAANALAAFETVAFRADKSPFDEYLRTGNTKVLGEAGARGMKLFYGKAACGRCHSGKFLTNQRFYAIAMPQLGPGKNDGWNDDYWRKTGFVGRFEDFGRFRETSDPKDMYAFRTPTLRNVELTGPWGHAGAYTTLEDVIRHHADPVGSLERYDPSTAILPEVTHAVELTADKSKLIILPVNPKRLADYNLRDTWVQRSPQARAAIAKANQLKPVKLSDKDVSDLVAFLVTLTDPSSRDMMHLVPERVPSGLPVED